MIVRDSKVRVTRVDDEFGDRDRIGKSGRVIRTIVNDHGASPRDPAFVVRFTFGRHVADDMFWGTELAEVSP